MKYLRGLAAVFLLLASISAAHAYEGTIQELDSNLTKERLRKIYNGFWLKPTGEWRVSYEGKTEKWKWSDKGWACPKTATLTCSEWIPYTLHWLVTGRSFLENWTPIERVAFEVGTPKVEKTAQADAGETDVAEENPDEHGSGEPAKFQGKRAAAELWKWQSKAGLVANLSLSLRNQWIERIDFKDHREILEWNLRRNHVTPDLTGITVEIGDKKVHFDRSH